MHCANAYLGHVGHFIGTDDDIDVLIDKLPLNILHLPLLWMMFPSARFILSLRHPADSCLSCFQQAFQLNEEMRHFTRLESCFERYRDVMNLGERFIAELQLDVCRVRYEDLVGDMDTVATAVFDFLNVTPDAGFHDFHLANRGRVIVTPSANQVTKPIYSSSRFRWKNYATQVAPLLPIVRLLIERYGYAEQRMNDLTYTAGLTALLARDGAVGSLLRGPQGANSDDAETDLRVQIAILEELPEAERAREAHAKVDCYLRDDVEQSKSSLSCRSGCAHCCKIPVHVTDAEADAAIAEAKRVDWAIDRRRLKRQSRAGLRNWSRLGAADRRCVFLGEDDRCRVYEHRPTACRLHNVLSAPDLCDTTKHGDDSKVTKFISYFAELVGSALYNLAEAELLADVVRRRLN